MKIKILATMITLMMLGSTLVAAVNIKNNINFKDISSLRAIFEPRSYLIRKYSPCDHPEPSISFPMDEGRHDPLFIYPVEWWYVNFHLIGDSTGTEYGAFVAFFKTPPQVRQFSISDLDLQKMYTNWQYGVLLASKSELDLTYLSLFNRDRWYTKTNGEEPDPFNYKLIVRGEAREEDNEMMELNVDMHCIKPPMLAGGDGHVDIGTGWSYYYCQTKIEVSGFLTVHGITEAVTGYAWIDHQWGLFDYDITYEWFSIKLDDFREIMVGDTWWRHNGEYCGSFSDGLNLFNSDYSFELLEDYTITPLGFWTDDVTGRRFAIKWRITEPSKQIDLVVTADFNNQVMSNPLLSSFLRLGFWEGSCSVSGTIEGSIVNGRAYVELTHSWEG